MRPCAARTGPKRLPSTDPVVDGCGAAYFPLRALSAKPFPEGSTVRTSVSCAGGCSANTVAFVGSGARAPHRAPSALCRRFAASGETSRLLRAKFLGTKRVCRPCRFRVSERGLRSPAVRGARLAFSSLFTEADRLPAAQQLLQRLKTNVSMAVKGTTMAACAVRETARKTKAEAPTPRP